LADKITAFSSNASYFVAPVGWQQAQANSQAAQQGIGQVAAVLNAGVIKQGIMFCNPFSSFVR
jgi:hypothetical protein